jgi:hypothetical protein
MFSKESDIANSINVSESQSSSRTSSIPPALNRFGEKWPRCRPPVVPAVEAVGEFFFSWRSGIGPVTRPGRSLSYRSREILSQCFLLLDYPPTCSFQTIAKNAISLIFSIPTLETVDGIKSGGVSLREFVFSHVTHGTCQVRQVQDRIR